MNEEELAIPLSMALFELRTSGKANILKTINASRETRRILQKGYTFRYCYQDLAGKILHEITVDKNDLTEQGDADGRRFAPSRIARTVGRRLETGFISPQFELTISLDLESKPNRILTPCCDISRRLSVGKKYTDTTRTGGLKHEFS